MQKVTIQNRENLDLAISYHPAIQAAQGLVFIEHGFTGHKDEPQIQTIAETFIKKNFTTILFDATSSTGESGISADGITFTSHYHDLQDVISWASAQTWYQKPFLFVAIAWELLRHCAMLQNIPQMLNCSFPSLP